jgi:outer membrane protein
LEIKWTVNAVRRRTMSGSGRGDLTRAVAGIAVFLAIAVFGNTSLRAESLIEALTAAYQSNPTLQGQRARLRAIDEGVAQALSGWRPEVELTGRGAKTQVRSNAATGNGDRTPYSTTLTLTQSIYDGGQTLAAASQAESEVIAARARLASVEQQVLLNAVTAYMNVVRDVSVLALNVGNEQVLVRQLEATRDRFSVGEVTRTDVAQAESRLAGAIADRRRSEGELEVSRATYRQIVGAMPGTLAKPELPKAPVADSVEAARLADEKNPDVLAAIHDEVAAQTNVRSVIGKLLPSVDLTASASRSRNQSIEDRTINTATVTASLTIPLYQKGSVSSRVREAKQLATRARRLIEEARRSAVQDATSAWEILVSAQARIEALDSQVRAAVIALDGVTQEATVGSRTVLDVLDAEQELLNAQVGLVGAQRDEVVAHFDLVAAVGELTARGLSLPVDPYDEKKYYNTIRNKWWGLDTGAAE